MYSTKGTVARDHRPLALSNCTSRQELAQPSQAVVLRN